MMRVFVLALLVALAAALAFNEPKHPGIHMVNHVTGETREIGMTLVGRGPAKTRDQDEAQIRLERTLETCNGVSVDKKRNTEISPNMECEDRVVDVFWHRLADGKCVDANDLNDDHIEINVNNLSDAFENMGLRFRLVGVKTYCDPYWNERCVTEDFWADGGFAEQHAHDPAHTLNIYSCAESDYCVATGSWPCHYEEDAPWHGVSVRSDVVVNNYAQYLPGRDEGDLLVHGVGHYFGLLNVFANKCSEPGDHVDDTNPQHNPTIDCPSEDQTSCGGALTNKYNFMDLSSDDCMEEFTPGQNLRMCQIRDVCRPSLGKRDVGCLDDCVADLPDDNECAVAYCERGEKPVEAPLIKADGGKPSKEAFGDEMQHWEVFEPSKRQRRSEQHALSARGGRPNRKFCHYKYADELCDDGIDCTIDTCDAQGQCHHEEHNCEGFKMEVGKAEICGDHWYEISLENDYEDAVVVVTPTYLHNCFPIVARVSDVSRNSFKVMLENPGHLNEIVCDPIDYVVVERGEWQVPLTPSQSIEDRDCTLQASKQWATSADICKDKQGSPAYVSPRFAHPTVLGQVMTCNDENWSTFWAHGGYDEWLEVFDCPRAHQLYIGMMSDDENDRLPEMLGYLVFEQDLVYHIDFGFTTNPSFNDINLNPVTEGDRPAFFMAGVTSASIKGVGNEPPYFFSIASQWQTPPNTVVSDSRAYYGFSSATTYQVFGDLDQPSVAVASTTGSRCTNCGWPVFYWETVNDWLQIQLAIEEDQFNDQERKHGPEKVSYFLSEYEWAWPGNPCRRPEIPPMASHSVPPPQSCAANDGNIWCAAMKDWMDMMGHMDEPTKGELVDHSNGARDAKLEDLRRSLTEFHQKLFTPEH